MEKYEFGGPEWTEVLRSTMRQALDLAGELAADTRYSISERYLDPPAHMASPEGELGWRAEIKDGQLLFDLAPSHDVDIYIQADYQSILPLARLVYGSDPEKQAEREKIVADLVSSGKLALRGDLTARPAFMEGVHDALAKVTA